MLTEDELTFLKVHGLSESDVYDGRNQTSARWKAGVRSTGRTLVLGTPCNKGGHRLRTRAGHCAQCDTGKLAYQSRYHSEGYVYIAGSRSEHLLKIGTTKDIEQRKASLWDYGGIRDWEMLFYVQVKNGGEIEGSALRSLRDYKVSRIYQKDQSDQEASELLQAPFGKVLEAVADAIGNADRKDIWRSQQWREYEWIPAT